MSPYSHPALTLNLQRQGSGEPLLCLHSSSASNSQWRMLAEHLETQRQLLLPDLLGHGRSPDWPAEAPASLSVESEALWAALDDVEAPLDIIGHSYGGAIALQMAIERPSRVRSLTLYEPVLFGLLKRYEGMGEAWAEISQTAHIVAELVAAGSEPAAAQLFCNYWAHGPAWQSMNGYQQARIARCMPAVVRHFKALFDAAWGPRELARLNRIPLRLVCGSLTRAPARRVSELLSMTLEHARLQMLPGSGHLGPISHGPAFASLVERLLGLTPMTALP
jgi:pimeloyl-ACP methyl ester carboxylesterase